MQKMPTKSLIHELADDGKSAHLHDALVRQNDQGTRMSVILSI